MVELPMRSLVIRGFRCFADLTVEPLGRVNLITGANGAGKSALLEALELYAHGGDLFTAVAQLQARRELGDRAAQPAASTDEVAARVRAIGRLFGGGLRGPLHTGAFDIGSPARMLSVTQTCELMRDGVPVQPRWQVVDSGGGVVLPEAVDEALALGHRPVYATYDAWHRSLKVGSGGLPDESLAALWDAVYMTPIEPEVVHAMRVVEPRIDTVGWRGPGNQYSVRTAWAKLAGEDEAVPVASLGEGVGRALGLALAATGAAGGWLLVDEIDTGLHHSTFPGLWRAVFSLAERLNVQVFATTHSRDCVLGFEQVLREQADADGALVWLQREGDQHFPAIYDREHLGVVAEFGLEVR